MHCAENIPRNQRSLDAFKLRCHIFTIFYANSVPDTGDPEGVSGIDKVFCPRKFCSEAGGDFKYFSPTLSSSFEC
jgi:hypothetical protein